MQRMGFLWFLSYAGTMILLHHLWLYNIEVLRPSEILNILLKTLASGAFTLVLVLLSQFITFNSKVSQWMNLKAENSLSSSPFW